MEAAGLSDVGAPLLNYTMLLAAVYFENHT